MKDQDASPAEDGPLIARARGGDVRAFEALYRRYVDDVEPEWSLDTPMEVGAIEAAIDGLPPGARDVLILSGIYGYAHTETAAMLGIAEGTCKAQLFRARALLRTALGMEDHR